MSFKLVILIQIVLAVAYARTPAEIRRWLMFEAFDCSQKHPMDAAQIKALLDHKPATTNNAKCFIACIYKKMKWMNKEGQFDIDKGYAFIDEEYPNNPTMRDNGKKIMDMCKIVNDEPDVPNGCDRASKLANCLIQNSIKMGINLEI